MSLKVVILLAMAAVVIDASLNPLEDIKNKIELATKIAKIVPKLLAAATTGEFDDTLKNDILDICKTFAREAMCGFGPDEAKALADKISEIKDPESAKRILSDKETQALLMKLAEAGVKLAVMG